MKKLSLLVITISLLSLNTKAQEVPVFKGTTYEDNGGMGKDEIKTWNYKGYIFISNTPGIARPFTTTTIYKKNLGELSEIKNNELFTNNLDTITEIVNSKLNSEFKSQKKEDPKCYKEFSPFGINDLYISVDKNFMYFEILWDDSFYSDFQAECIYPSTIAKINLSEIADLIGSNLNVQLQTVFAEGGDKFIDWSLEKKKTENNEDNPFLYGSGCTESPSRAGVSSTLGNQGNSSYSADNIFDWDPQTAWVEGKSDYGIGEFFEVNLPFGGSSVTIFNGYQKSYESWFNNSRVKKMKVYVDGVALCYVKLKDLMGYQTFNLPNDYMVNYTNYRFEIVEVYPGAKWKDVAISEICNLGCCFNSNTFIQSVNGLISAGNLNSGDMLNTIDTVSNQIGENPITQMIEIKHNKLILLQTNFHSIEMTSYHPLYFKGYGFNNLLNIMKSKKLINLKELENELEVLVWDEKCQETTYEKITNIKVIEGEFKTFSILGIDKANTYIINGFVSTTNRYPK